MEKELYHLNEDGNFYLVMPIFPILALQAREIKVGTNLIVAVKRDFNGININEPTGEAVVISGNIIRWKSISDNITYLLFGKSLVEGKKIIARNEGFDASRNDLDETPFFFGMAKFIDKQTLLHYRLSDKSLAMSLREKKISEVPKI